MFNSATQEVKKSFLAEVQLATNLKNPVHTLGSLAMNEQESAEVVALQAFGWLVSQPDLLAGFLDMSGAGKSELASLAGSPVFLAAVVDFLLETDERVVACAEALGWPNTALKDARAGLPGGLDPHWT